MSEIKFKKQIIALGSSSGITIPPEIIGYLEVVVGDIVVISAEQGKRGKFIAVFKE